MAPALTRRAVVKTLPHPVLRRVGGNQLHLSTGWDQQSGWVRRKEGARLAPSEFGEERSEAPRFLRSTQALQNVTEACNGSNVFSSRSYDRTQLMPISSQRLRRSPAAQLHWVESRPTGVHAVPAHACPHALPPSLATTSRSNESGMRRNKSPRTARCLPLS